MRLKDFYRRFQLYVSNVSWIMAQRILQLTAGFLMAILVPRYLGPEKFGILAYATSLVGLFASMGHMGLSGLVVREIVKNPQDSDEILGTTFLLKGVGVLIGFSALIITVFLTESTGSLEFWVLTISAIYLLFQPFQILTFWFQSQVEAKFITISQLSGLLSSCLFKVALVAAGVGLVPFAFANLIQAAIVTALLTFLYKTRAMASCFSWTFSAKRARTLLGQGWLIFLGSIFAIIYLKVDQIMLRWLVGPAGVGIYSAAATLSEVWYFVPDAIVISLFPRLIKLRDSNPNLYQSRLQQIFDLLFLLALSVAIVITFIAKPLILSAYGSAYLESASILAIHVWAGLFIFMRAAFSKWILMENALAFSLITQGLGAISNVILNLILIPRLGGYGAAIATITSYAAASYFSLFLYSRTRGIFWMMTRSFVLVPTFGWRYWRKQLV